jgi:vacuolar-type H+-ATPase catalytic subunit A/Vma1
MPSISGIEIKIANVLNHTWDLDTQARFSELRDNMVRFDNDRETREQAERRIMDDVLSNLNHSNCSICDSLRSAL